MIDWKRVRVTESAEIPATRLGPESTPAVRMAWFGRMTDGYFDAKAKRYRERRSGRFVHRRRVVMADLPIRRSRLDEITNDLIQEAIAQEVTKIARTFCPMRHSFQVEMALMGLYDG